MADKGSKRVCPFCGVVFYDLGKPDLACPYCGKKLEAALEIDFIKRKKKAESKQVADAEKDMTGIDDMESVGDDEGEVFLDDADTDFGSKKEDE
jgi:hypothetical protein